ncbi:phosphotransferase family protein [Aspergillus mulundensis]|uniref:Aminoglycoside phosphotransferase domain-containing protein n=1 Tax=Aspergillus mulundensis TaxID=1810919 RepID=A0A3D8QMA3_9EURO|nr:hypothetical protein DSM5745_10036 [Aspergillus mulundensis]RDW62925.1 hypothetical protein DSM5745_10036 [Aspergillus mulundensis]
MSPTAWGTGMWSCDVERCDKPSVRTDGACILCNRHLCATHVDDPYHKCPNWEDAELWCPAASEAEKREVTTLFNKIIVTALLSRASHLRKGVPCSLAKDLKYDPSTRGSVMGGQNIHVEIQFEDGILWLARIRRVNAMSPPLDLRRYILLSEAATLQFLSSETKIPVPRIFDYQFDEGNPIGVGYIIYEKIPGKPLNWPSATTEQKHKIIDQLADIYIELRSRPFDLLGSLDQPGTSHIGPLAGETHTDYKADGQMRPLGPFTNLNDFLRASIEFTLDLIRRGERYASRPIDAFLIHRFLLDSIPALIRQIQPRGTNSNSQLHSKCYLTHADSKGDHVLTDPNHAIAAMIDWEWAHTAPASLAFNSPVMLLPVADFYDGVTQIGEDEEFFAQVLQDKGHPDLAEIVRKGRVLHFFVFCCGYPGDWEGYLGLFGGLRRALDSGGDGELEWEAWREKMLIVYKEDAILRELMAR